MTKPRFRLDIESPQTDRLTIETITNECVRCLPSSLLLGIGFLPTTETVDECHEVHRAPFDTDAAAFATLIALSV